MRRLVGPVLGLLLVGGMAQSATAQRTSALAPTAVIEEPRPNPVLPAALVPFVIPAEVCRKDHTPLVALKVYNVLAQPVATLRLRSRRAEMVPSLVIAVIIPPWRVTAKTCVFVRFSAPRRAARSR